MAGLLQQFKDLRSTLNNLGKSANLGLDVGSFAIKLAELKKNGASFKLMNFAHVPLSSDVIVNREIVNAIAVGDAIRSAVEEVNPAIKLVAAAIGGSNLIIKRMNLEVENIKELDDQVLWEAEQYIPFDIADVVVDYQKVTEGNEKQVEVLLSAVKRDFLESTMAVIQDSGLTPKVIDADVFALHNCFENNYPEKLGNTVGIIDVGAFSLKLLITSEGFPTFTKEATLGGRNLTADIAKHLKLSEADAEALKVGDQSQGVPQEVSELMNIACENLSLEIKRSIDFYNASSAGSPVQELLLTGGCSLLPGLFQLIQERTGLPTQALDPLAQVEVDNGLFEESFLDNIRATGAVTIGLAMRGSK